jgi:hypothetical protein
LVVRVSTKLDLSDPGLQWANICGDITYADLTGNADLDVYTAIAADIEAIAGAVSSVFSYSVTWGVKVVINNPIPPTISAFPSFPERRYVGNLNFCTGSTVSYLRQLNHGNNTMKGGRFIYSTLISRLASIVDFPYTSAVTGNFLLSPNGGYLGAFDTRTEASFEEYVDRLLCQVFPGMSYTVKIGYNALNIWRVFGTNISRYSPI